MAERKRSPKQPRTLLIAEWILELLIPPHMAEHIVGDLNEDFAEWSRQVGPVRARLRVAKQTFRAAVAFRPISRLAGGVVSFLTPALRAVRRRPSPSLTVLSSVAVAVGANVSIFGLVETVLVRPLPYSGADRINVIWTSSEVYPPAPSLSGPEFFDLEERTSVFEAVEAAFGWRAAMRIGTSEPFGVQQARASSGFFDLLGVDPRLGRFPTPEEDHPGSPGLAVLTHGLWRQAFGAAEDVVGQVAEIDGEEVTVIGVLPDGFRAWIPPEAPWATPADVLLNLRYARDSFPRARRHLLVLAKARPGISRTRDCE